MIRVGCRRDNELNRSCCREDESNICGIMESDYTDTIDCLFKIQIPPVLGFSDISNQMSQSNHSWK